MKKTEKKRPRGRPITENPLRKRYFRATDDQWQEFQGASDGNVSRWIREVCSRAVERLK